MKNTRKSRFIGIFGGRLTLIYLILVGASSPHQIFYVLPNIFPILEHFAIIIVIANPLIKQTYLSLYISIPQSLPRQSHENPTLCTIGIHNGNPHTTKHPACRRTVVQKPVRAHSPIDRSSDIRVQGGTLVCTDGSVGVKFSRKIIQLRQKSQWLPNNPEWEK